jgi:hypothetical protein
MLLRSKRLAMCLEPCTFKSGNAQARRVLITRARHEGLIGNERDLTAVALHVVADDCAIGHVEGGEQGRGAVNVCSRASSCRRGRASSATLAGYDPALIWLTWGFFRLATRGRSID